MNQNNNIYDIESEPTIAISRVLAMMSCALPLSANHYNYYE
jgi:hypothetical protein